MKILIVTKNWLGDTLFQIPAIEMIRSRYPEAEILCMTHPRCREMLENHPAIDRLLLFDERSTHRSLKEKIRFFQELKRERIDIAYLFHRSRTRAFLLWLAGIQKRIGYAAKKPNFLTQAFPEPKRPLHHVDYFVHLLREAGFPPCPEPSYTFHVAEKDRQAVQHQLESAGLQHSACFHLGANWEPKRWPASHFARLADLIHEKWNLPVILTGGPGDRRLGEEVICEIKNAKVLSWIGKTTLGELGALYRQASFVVSGDSGPMHIASGVGTRVVALFGPTDPDHTGPRGKGEKIILSYVPEGYRVPWYGKHFPKEWLSQISPEEVMEALVVPGTLRDRSPRRPVPAVPGTTSILLITLSNIGDVILTTPVLMSLAARFPGHELTVVVGPRAKGVLEGSRFIHRLIVYDKQSGLREKIKFLRELRKEKYEAVVDLKNSAVPFLVSAKKRSPLFRPFKTAARERHLQVLERMGLQVHDIPPFDFFNEEEEAGIFSKLRKKGIGGDQGWIAVAPVAASELKTWPVEKFKEVIQGLLQETSYSIFLIGGERESRMMAPLVSVDPARVFNLAGETTLREAAVLIRKSQMLLANDSAAAQLGFEMNHPTAVIFGPTDPRKFAREGKRFRILREAIPCSPCEKSFCRFERQACLLDLGAEKVLQACLELLQSPDTSLRGAPSGATKQSQRLLRPSGARNDGEDAL